VEWFKGSGISESDRLKIGNTNAESLLKLTSDPSLGRPVSAG